MPAAAPPPPAAAAADPEHAVQRVREIFAQATQTPRWPMYVRQVKQFLRANDEGFDERKFGFGSIVDVLRAAQRERILRDLHLYLADNTQAWLLRPDGSYARVETGTEAPVCAQKQLLELYAAGPGSIA